MAPIYIFDVPANIGEAPFISVKSFPALVSPGEKVDGVLSVANLLPVPLKGQLEINSPKSTVYFSKDIILAPGQRQDVTFRMEAGALARGKHALIAKLSQQEGREITSTEYQFASEGAAQSVPMMPHAIHLDGDPSDWQNIPEEIADTATRAVIGRPPVGYYDTNTWQGAKDLSFSVKTAWRPDDGIYLFITVTDDVIKTVPPELVHRAFLKDGLELFFDGRPLNKQTPSYSFGAEQILVVPAVESTTRPCLYKSLTRYGNSVDIEFVGKRIDSGYVMEGRIRPKTNAPFKLVPGARFGMDIVFDDADESEMTRKTQMALHGTANNCNDASGFGRYQLIGGSVRSSPNLLGDKPLKGDGENAPGWKFSNASKNMPDASVSKIKKGVKEIDGKKALWISIATEAQAHVMWTRTIPARGKTAYSVSFRLKRTIDGKMKYCNGGGSVIFLGDKGAWLGWHPIGNANAISTGDWGTYSGTFLTPAGTQTVGFRFSVLSNDVQGTADFYCSDIVLSEQQVF
jgi:hypothetical protein